MDPMRPAVVKKNTLYERRALKHSRFFKKDSQDFGIENENENIPAAYQKLQDPSSWIDARWTESDQY